MAGVDINRTTEGIYLPSQLSSEIWADAQEQSFVMQRATRTDLPGSGKTFQMITGDGTAKFVTETGRKPVSNPTFGKKEMKAHKIALVNSFSDEFQRDKAALYNALRPRLAGAIAKTFDLAALHGIGAPESAFDNLSTAPAVELASPSYDALVGALRSVATAGGQLNAWGLSGAGEATVLLEKDQSGRPLFISSVNSDRSVGSILGRPVYLSEHVADAETNTVGIAGDWASAFWGSVTDIAYEEYGGPIYNEDGSLMHAGRQDNMFSVIAEIEIGFIVKDENRFARLTEAAAA